MLIYDANIVLLLNLYVNKANVNNVSIILKLQKPAYLCLNKKKLSAMCSLRPDTGKDLNLLHQQVPLSHQNRPRVSRSLLARAIRRLASFRPSL